MARQSKPKLDSHRLERTSFVDIVVGTIIYPEDVFPIVSGVTHDALCDLDAFEHAPAAPFAARLICSGVAEITFGIRVKGFRRRYTSPTSVF